MFFVLALLVLTAYIGNGIRVTRNQYAYRTYELQSSPDEVKKELNLLKHADWCYLKFGSLKSQGCSCGSKKKWLNLISEEAAYNVNYHLIITWPFFSLHRFITSAPPQRVPRLDKGEAVETDEATIELLAETNPTSHYYDQHPIFKTELSRTLEEGWEKILAAAEADAKEGKFPIDKPADKRYPDGKKGKVTRYCSECRSYRPIYEFSVGFHNQAFCPKTPRIPTSKKW